jgi:hypothetical protein
LWKRVPGIGESLPTLSILATICSMLAFWNDSKNLKRFQYSYGDDWTDRYREQRMEKFLKENPEANAKIVERRNQVQNAARLEILRRNPHLNSLEGNFLDFHFHEDRNILPKIDGTTKNENEDQGEQKLLATLIPSVAQSEAYLSSLLQVKFQEINSLLENAKSKAERYESQTIPDLRKQLRAETERANELAKSMKEKELQLSRDLQEQKQKEALSSKEIQESKVLVQKLEKSLAEQQQLREKAEREIASQKAKEARNNEKKDNNGALNASNVFLAVTVVTSIWLAWNQFKQSKSK